MFPEGEDKVPARGVQFLPFAIDRGDQFRRCDDCVLPHLLRRCAAVIVGAEAARIAKPRVASNAGDHAYWDAAMLEDRTLLDVKLEITPDAFRIYVGRIAADRLRI